MSKPERILVRISKDLLKQSITCVGEDEEREAKARYNGQIEHRHRKQHLERQSDVEVQGC